MVRLSALAFGVILLTAAVHGVAQGTGPRTASLKSPDGHIAFELRIDPANPLACRVTRDGIPALDWSSAGIGVDGANIAERALGSDLVVRSTHEDYPTRGVHAIAHNRSNNQTFGFQQDKTGVRRMSRHSW